VRLDADWDEIGTLSPDDLPAAGGPDNLAYCIYTSGSTGRPKGALLRHRGLCNLADVQARAFDIRPGKRILQFSPFSFDASVWETVMALRSGATLVLARQAALASGAELLRLLQEAHITTVTLPPSLLAVLEPSSLPELETVIAAGERCTNEIVQRWAGNLAAGSARRFFNAYGPTETTVCASMHLCDPAVQWPFGGPPIGRPIANFQCYVVDAFGAGLQVQPMGVPGELIVGGVGVAKGYLNRPELTAERFIPRLPFVLPGRGRGEPAAAAGGPFYRTGDLVRWLPGGELEYLGRIDDQVKVRGFRIELGEIESVLREHPSVKDAVVAARGDMLVGYVIPASGAELAQDGPAAEQVIAEPAEPRPPLRDALRAHLRRRLPEYMTPAVIVELEAFPLSPAGKVDRRALPAPDQARREVAAEYVAPRTPLEESLAALCAELLEVERVGVEDNFFELGGHSLLATRLIARVRDRHSVEVPLAALFEKPTVAGLAQAVEQAQRAPASPASQAPAITARSREGRRRSRSAIDADRDDLGQGQAGPAGGQGDRA
jgi:amino acid adenylation domain-containing protein